MKETVAEHRQRFLKDLHLAESPGWLPDSWGIDQEDIKREGTFSLCSSFKPTGDQPNAINFLTNGLIEGKHDQVLLGVTGSGKTFTMANVIEAAQVPTLIMAPNKTLAAQLFQEMKDFFPNNRVEYFVSYYDYYQPEAYVPTSDTYISKESTINDEIDRMRHSATRALFERKDSIIVSSVSCIYGIGSVQDYGSMVKEFLVGQTVSDMESQLRELQYEPSGKNYKAGTYSKRDNIFEIFPPHTDQFYWELKIDAKDFRIEYICLIESDHFNKNPIDSLGERKRLNKVRFYPNSHYILRKTVIENAIKKIESDMKERLEYFHQLGKKLEAARLEERTLNDMQMLLKTGSCKGIENYTRYFTGRPAGAPPPTLIEYVGRDSLLLVDESHITVPQIRGMFRGDFKRKWTLAEYGWRLPSCVDNRPLKFSEWEALRPRTIYISATPAEWEIKKSDGAIVEQIVRPTGLLDPICHIKSSTNQVKDLLEQCKLNIKENKRVLVTTLTKAMAENLSEYFHERGLKVRYLHSDVKTLDRIELIKQLRDGVFDILVGINLLREGLDIPECGLVAILDADKEGFLRSETSLTQTIGRAARHPEGQVILYADNVTKSLQDAINKNKERRERQIAYNSTHKITPKIVQKNKYFSHEEKDLDKLKKMMEDCANNLNFEKAAMIRNQIKTLQSEKLKT